MLSKSTSPAPASQALETQKQRNKLNQRAFRQRRQQRVQELEEKLRQHEATQLKATQQMQQAARVVAAENAMLRDVLKQRLGMGEREIEVLRRDWIAGNGNANGIVTFTGTVDDARSTGNEIEGVDEKIQRRGHIQQEPANSTSSSTSEQSRESVKEFSGPRCCDPRSHDTDPSAPPSSHTDSSVFMSCEKAAEILSSIRSQDELYDVRVRLGCTSPNTCSVENTKILDIMDEAI